MNTRIRSSIPSIPRLALAASLITLIAPSWSRAQPQLAITPANQNRGFVITSFASGFGWWNYPPHLQFPGVAFLPTNEVLVSDPLGSGYVYRFPSHADSQVVDSTVVFRSVYEGQICYGQIVQVLSNGVWRFYTNLWGSGDIVELDPTTGDPIRSLGLDSVYGNSALVAFPPGIPGPLEGHFFAILGHISGLAIFDIDPVTGLASLFKSFPSLYPLYQTQMAFSPDGSTLYALTINPPRVVALTVPGGIETWYSPSHLDFPEGGAYYGIAVGAGSLDGYIYVSTSLNIWEFGVPGGPHDGVDNLLATEQPGPSVPYPMSTMFVDPDVTCPGGYPSLLVVVHDAIMRIDPPGGGWFGCPTSSFSPVAVSAVPVFAGSDDFLRLAISPNPSTSEAHIDFTLATGGHVQLEVLDLQGRVVAVLDQGFRSAGTHRTTWSGTTDKGRAPAGIYFVRIRGGGRSITRKVSLLR